MLPKSTKLLEDIRAATAFILDAADHRLSQHPDPRLRPCGQRSGMEGDSRTVAQPVRPGRGPPSRSGGRDVTPRVQGSFAKSRKLEKDIRRNLSSLGFSAKEKP